MDDWSTVKEKPHKKTKTLQKLMMEDLQLTQQQQQQSGNEYGTQQGYTFIQNKYCFSYLRRSRGKNSQQDLKLNYHGLLKPIGISFQTVEGFWQSYNHIKRADNVPYITEFHMFRDGIKPEWEDSQNARGGKWMMKLAKGLASRYWEDLLLAIIGEQFDVGNEVCGAVLSCRRDEDIISVWNRNTDNQEATAKIKDQVLRILQLPNYITLEYKKHLVDPPVDNNITIAPETTATTDKIVHNNNNNGALNDIQQTSSILQQQATTTTTTTNNNTSNYKSAMTTNTRGNAWMKDENQINGNRMNMKW